MIMGVIDEGLHGFAPLQTKQGGQVVEEAMLVTDARPEGQ